MAIKVKIGDIEFSCDTAAEAREIAGLNGTETHVSREGGRNGKATDRRKLEKKRQDALRFLRVIATDAGDGVDADTLVRILKLKGRKGIGGTSSQVNKVLEDAQFLAASVYESVRTNDGSRRWYARGRMIEALQCLEGGG